MNSVTGIIVLLLSVSIAFNSYVLSNIRKFTSFVGMTSTEYINRSASSETGWTTIPLITSIVVFSIVIVGSLLKTSKQIDRILIGLLVIITIVLFIGTAKMGNMVDQSTIDEVRKIAPQMNEFMDSVEIVTIYPKWASLYGGLAGGVSAVLLFMRSRHSKF